MTNTTREILLARKAELTAKLQPMFARTKEIRKELNELEGEIRKLAADFDAVEVALKAVDASNAKGEQLTIMQAVLEVLKDSPQGLTAREILSEINQSFFGGSIVRESLSPQLSRLKDRDKKIDLIGKKWVLKPQTDPTLFTAKDRWL
jgi:predicted nuclease with TOPRIM domain